MRLLLDTNILLWVVAQPARVTEDARFLLDVVSEERLFSAVSIWEIAMKASLGRPDFGFDPARVAAAARSDFRELVVSSEAAVRVASLPFLHRDPFDRLLLAQALEENAVLITSDKTLSLYGPYVRFVG